MPAEVNTTRHVSRMLTGKTDCLSDIQEYIARHFTGPGQRYVLGDFHPRCKDPKMLKLRTQIFPRVTPLGTKEIMPLFFIVDKKK